SGTNWCLGTANIAARTAASEMPRRRNCFSIISARCGAYSLVSSMRNRCGVFFPRVCLQNFFHLCKGELAFFLAVVKLLRKAHTGFGPVIDQNFPRKKLLANFIRVGTFDGNGSRSLCWILRRVDGPPAGFRALDETRRPADRFLANRMYPNLIEDLQAGLAREQRGNVRRAVQVPERVLTRIDRASLKREWPAMRDPARE